MKLCQPSAKAIGADTGLGQIQRLATQPASPTEQRGSVQQLNLLDKFVQHVHSFVDISSLRPLKVVADTANGMGGLVVPAAFNALPFDLEILYEELDGPSRTTQLTRSKQKTWQTFNVAFSRLGQMLVWRLMVTRTECSSSTNERFLLADPSPQP